MNGKPTYKFAKEHNTKKKVITSHKVTEEQLRSKPYKSVIFF